MQVGQNDTLCMLLAHIARDTYVADWEAAQNPQPGDLVVEVTGWRRPTDPDSIGYLVGHDQAPHNEDDPLDGSVPMREVWDVRPLTGRQQKDWGYQRWENAEFKRVPDWVASGLLPALMGTPAHA